MTNFKIVPAEPTEEMLRVACDEEQRPLPMWTRMKAIYTATLNEAPVINIVATKNEQGQIVSVTLQDEDHRILEVIAEADVQGKPVGYIRRSTIELMKNDELGVRANIVKEPRYQDCVALYTALQPAEQQPEVLAKGYFHPLPDENDYEFHAEENFPDGNYCPECVPAVIVRKGAVVFQPAPYVADYEQALEDQMRLTRELDVLLNGEEGAAQQASLADLVAQLRTVVRNTGKPILAAPDVSELVK